LVYLELVYGTISELCMGGCGIVLTPQCCDMEQTEGNKGTRVRRVL